MRIDILEQPQSPSFCVLQQVTEVVEDDVDLEIRQRTAQAQTRKAAH